MSFKQLPYPYQVLGSKTVVSSHLSFVAFKIIVATKALLLPLFLKFERNGVHLSLEIFFWTTVCRRI